MAGMSVLDLSHNNLRVEQEAADPYQLVLAMLAAITELRSRNIFDIAIIIRAGATARVPLHQLQSQLFARCIATSLKPFSTWNDMTMQLTELTSAVRLAVDSIRGLAYLHAYPDEHEAASPGATGHFEIASSEAVGAEDVYRTSGALYAWTLATVKLNPAFAVTQHQVPVGSSLPQQHLGTALTSSWRAEAGRARTVMRENLHYLQKQWDAILIDLAERDGSRAARVRTRLAIAVIPSDGHRVDNTAALRAARLTWHLLDKLARYHWLDACDQAFSAQGLRTFLPESSIGVPASPLH
jgi:hypothetical protein